MTLLSLAAASLLAAIISPHVTNAFCTHGKTARLPSPSSILRPIVSLELQQQPLQCRIIITTTTATARLHSKSANDDNSNNANDATEKDDDSSTNTENPYADPNFPDLEFVNYDDPDYQFDRGIEDDELFPSRSSSKNNENEDTKTLAEIEAMREERRRRNDEYQFETYHAKVLRGGEISLGEWTVFQTDTFMGEEVWEGRHPEAKHVPRLLKWDKVLKVVSRGEKIVIDGEASWRVDGERIVHEERLATLDDFPYLMEMMGGGEEEMEELSWEEEDHGHVSNTFWPREMESIDFRGPGGNMCVGKAYTICDALPLNGEEMDDKSAKNDRNVDSRHEGPFREMRTELGIQEAGMRFRIKLDYSVLDDERSTKSASSSGSDADSSASNTPPPLHLRTLTVCRETLDGYWPNSSDNKHSDENPPHRRNQSDIAKALFGPPGAQGGLYDPPPVGGEERAISNYMILDFEGGATVLLPHRLDQHHPNDENADATNARESFGWVTSLDWTPGPIRYQVDRKVLSGAKLKGLRTLELSEVQSSDAERWRPRDGGANMRQ